KIRLVLPPLAYPNRKINSLFLNK
uniref:Uncharacterized protein n=1 Tax=Solanum lycopersicum TaxID=4081 RepID=A0A3Q7EGS4_SOLLC